MAKEKSLSEAIERARVNLILDRGIWGKIRSEAFEQRKSASALINESFEEYFKKKKKSGGAASATNRDF